MVKMKNSLAVILFSVLFVFLLYKQSLGLNLLIFNFSILIWIIIDRKFEFVSLNQILIIGGFVLTTIFSVIIHTIYVYFINAILYFILAGIIVYPETKNLLSSIGISFGNIFISTIEFIKKLISDIQSNLKIKSNTILSKAILFILPIFIIFVFIGMYSFSSPIFDNISTKFFDIAFKPIEKFFEIVEIGLLIFFIFGIIITSFILFPQKFDRMIKTDKSASLNYQRVKKKYYITNFKNLSLKYEYYTGIFLLVTLNLILLVVNMIDIKFLWFTFEWNGQLLKDFVHEGTYMLIISIFISIVIILYYFRGNLNLYYKSEKLRKLTYFWLAQNAFLTLSVGLRTYWYIYHYNLAYKRIALIFVLLFILFVLYTVFIKVKHKKSFFYLTKLNTAAFIIIMIISSLFNWDNIIAKYNFNHYKNSFIEYSYLSGLSSKSLPYLQKSLSELNNITTIQKNKFPDEIYRNTMSPTEYHRKINSRITRFKEKWEKQSFLEWNYADYKAYNLLKKRMKY